MRTYCYSKREYFAVSCCQIYACSCVFQHKKLKVAHTRLPPERRVPELIPVLGSQPAGDVSHKPGVRLPLLSAGLRLPLKPLRGLLPISLLDEQRHNGCEQFA